MNGARWRNKQYTYAIYRVDGAEMLFDHEKDPDEMVAACIETIRRMRRFRDEMKAQMKAMAR